MPEIKEILHGCNAIELEIQIGLYCWLKKNFLRDCKTNKKRTGGPHNEKSRFFVYFFFLVGSFNFSHLPHSIHFVIWGEWTRLNPLSLSQLRTLEQWAYILSASLLHSNGLCLYTITHIGPTLDRNENYSVYFFSGYFSISRSLFVGWRLRIWAVAKLHFCPVCKYLRVRNEPLTLVKWQQNIKEILFITMFWLDVLKFLHVIQKLMIELMITQISNNNKTDDEQNCIHLLFKFIEVG